MAAQSTAARIAQFMKSEVFAVIGASTDRSKFGNKVLRAYLAKKLTVIPVHPKELEVEGLACVKTVKDLPPSVSSISVVTPPPVTEKVVEDAIAKGTIKNIWMQPGAESEKAVKRGEEAGLNMISGGPCVLVEFRAAH